MWKLAQLLMLLQPSSGAAERAFSRLVRILRREGMDSALHETVEATLMVSMTNGPREVAEFVYEIDD